MCLAAAAPHRLCADLWRRRRSILSFANVIERRSRQARRWLRHRTLSSFTLADPLAEIWPVIQPDRRCLAF